MPTHLPARILRALFYLLYHQLSWSYDLVAAAVSLGHWRSWVLSVLPEIQGPVVLELGFGPGHLQSAMHARGLAVHGLDTSPQMSRQARRRLLGAGFRPYLVRGQSQALPYPAAHFSQVVATFPANYIFEAEALGEIRRVLAPGGSLVVLPMAWLKGKRLLTRIWQPLLKPGGRFPADFGRIAAPFNTAGFTTRVEVKSHSKWSTVVIRAQKS